MVAFILLYLQKYMSAVCSGLINTVSRHGHLKKVCMTKTEATSSSLELPAEM